MTCHFPDVQWGVTVTKKRKLHNQRARNWRRRRRRRVCDTRNERRQSSRKKWKKNEGGKYVVITNAVRI
jgi:hypothetical protein